MRLAILGASGRTGRILAQLATAAGHAVSAVVRAHSALPADVPFAAVHRGPLQDADFLREALRGHDAVLCAVGARMRGYLPWQRPERDDVLAQMAPPLVEALHELGIRRLVAISAAGVGESAAQVPSLLNLGIAASALRFAYADLERFEATLRHAPLDLTLVRPTVLTDGRPTGRARVVARAGLAATIPRADLAAWMLDEVARPGGPERTPLLTVTG
jgi:putative NADH-flavin reductase